MRTRLAAVAVLAVLPLAALPAWAAEATFERTLTVHGRPDLSVATGSGSIRLTAGPAGQIHIVGHVRSSWGASDDEVREIAAHPPIEQTGSIVRIGMHMQHRNGISIAYEIEAPADSYLKAGTGSGSIEDQGVGTQARIHTGSGQIRASGLQGGFTLDTGSGSIYADQVGRGDATAQTGSGSIELRNLTGALQAKTGSGSITVAGTPTGPWELHTGSGRVEVTTGDSGFDLDASSGSGSIHIDRQISQSSQSKHHVAGRVGSGGPNVRISTGSGSIRVQ